MEIDTGVNKESTSVIHSTGTGIAEHLHSYIHRLYLYVQEVLKNEDLDETLTRLTQENINLKEQLAELRKRERAYLSKLKDIPPPAYASYQRERALHVKNLHHRREQAAMYGPLEIPLHIRNEIEALEKLINEIDAHIARSKANETDWI